MRSIAAPARARTILDCYLLALARRRCALPKAMARARAPYTVEQGRDRLARRPAISIHGTFARGLGALRVQRIACDQVLYNLDERTLEDHELPWAREYGCASRRLYAARSARLDPRERGSRSWGYRRPHGVTPHADRIELSHTDPLVFAIPKAARREHTWRPTQPRSALDLDSRARSPRSTPPIQTANPDRSAADQLQRGATAFDRNAWRIRRRGLCTRAVFGEGSALRERGGRRARCR